MKKFAAYFCFTAIGAALVLAAEYFGVLPHARRTAERADVDAEAAPPGARRVVALARIEPAAGVVDLGGLPGDRIASVAAVVGKNVRRDDELVVFESRALRKLEAEAARAQLDEATERLKAEQRSAEARLNVAQLAVDAVQLDEIELSAQRIRHQSLTAGRETARSDFVRLSQLDAAYSSPQQLDHARLMRDRAEHEWSAGGESLKKLETAVALKRREAEAVLEQARAARAAVDAAVPLESLRRVAAAAEERLRQGTLRAPCDGVVVEVAADAGDSVGQLPLVRMADVSQLIARAEVYETQVGAVAVGQTCSITSDALPAPLVGTVERIGVIVGKNRLTSLDPLQSVDNRVVDVRIRLHDATAARRLLNLQTTATIDVGMP